MDYEKLLKKYMTILAITEECTFLDILPHNKAIHYQNLGGNHEYTWEPLTEDELNELKRIDSEIS